MQEQRINLIRNFIEDLEKDKDITILYCAETGSRGYGTNTDKSDSDIKGFFIRQKNKYLKVKEYANMYSKQHMYLDDKNEIEIDYTFVDIQYYLERKATIGHADQQNLWLLSEIQYVNKLPQNIINLILENIEPPQFALKGHLKQYTRDLQDNKIEITAKFILNVIVNSTQLLYILFYKYQNQKKLPLLNVQKQIQKLIEIKQDIQNKNITIDGKIQQVLQNIEKIQQIFEQALNYKSQGGNFENLQEIKDFLLNWIQNIINLGSQDSNSSYSESQKLPEMNLQIANEIYQQILK